MAFQDCAHLFVRGHVDPDKLLSLGCGKVTDPHGDLRPCWRRVIDLFRFLSISFFPVSAPEILLIDNFDLLWAVERLKPIN